MRRLAQWLIIFVLVSVYLTALFALLHPKVTPAYKAYYIERTTSDWNPKYYPGTPEQGMNFSREGLPEWVASTYGFSSRDQWGRWTDGDLGGIPAIAFTRGFNGTLCLEFTASPASFLIGKTIGVQMGNQTKVLQVIPRNYAEYRVQFADMTGANRVKFLLPKGLPRASEVDHGNAETRRIGLQLATLRILQGSCDAVQELPGTRR